MQPRIPPAPSATLGKYDDLYASHRGEQCVQRDHCDNHAQYLHRTVASLHALNDGMLFFIYMARTTELESYTALCLLHRCS